MAPPSLTTGTRLSRDPDHGEAVDPTPFLGPSRGPYLFSGPAAAAATAVAQRAESLGLVHGTRPADTFLLDGDPVAAITAALRDHVILRRRTLEKVYEGRVLSITPRPEPRGPLDIRMPPPAVDVALETDEDHRTLNLQGAYARAFLALGAAIGDVIQIAQSQPLASLRPDREVVDGRVAEERDFVHRLRLGDQDRSWPRDIDPQAAEVEDAPPASPGATLLGVGRGPIPTRAAMQATDRWVRTRTGDKGTRLEPAFLLITNAHHLDPSVRVALREAIASGSAPVVVLQTEDAEGHDTLVGAFPESAPWPDA